MFSEDERSEDSNVESDKMRTIAEFVNEDAPGIEPVRLLNDDDDASTTTGFAKSGRRGKISLFYEWKSCQFVCLRSSEETESIPTVTLNHRGRSKKRRNATVQRRRINRLGYVCYRSDWKLSSL